MIVVHAANGIIIKPGLRRIFELKYSCVRVKQLGRMQSRGRTLLLEEEYTLVEPAWRIISRLYNTDIQRCILIDDLT